MADSRRPALQLFDQLFGEQLTERNTGLSTLKTYLEQEKSIFRLVEMGKPGLVREMGLSPDDAERFLRSANSMATYVRRQFIEHTLTGKKGATTRSSSGLLSMVRGPNYQGLIGTDFAALCPPDALESIASHVAYLMDLLHWIEDRIRPENQQEHYQLHKRRTDLLALKVDFNAVYQSISSVDIIVAVLEQFIAANRPGVSIEDALIDACYPNGLPYYQHWVTIDSLAQANDLSVGDVAHCVDPDFPYFLQADARGANTASGFAHASRLGPYQQRLLTTPFPDLQEREAFYALHFGTNNQEIYGNLNQVKFLGKRTKLSSKQIEALLSIRDFAPVRSPNVTYQDTQPEKPESERSGSVYVNDGSEPPLDIDEGATNRHWVTADPDDKVGFNRFGRINQMVRLANWTRLPFDQVDALLVAAIRAVARGHGAESSVESEMNITSGVVHALGLFQTLRERYGCSAADFAVFIDELSVYGRGEALSLFDQTFNERTGYRESLRLDNGTFSVIPVPGKVDLTISQLCRGLAIDLQTYYVLATTVAKAHGRTDSLTRSPAIISSFYRLVHLSRLLKITPVEGVLLLSVLGDSQWVDGVAGIPCIHTVAEGPPDVLELIEAMHGCMQWCAQSRLPLLWVLQHAVEPPPAQQSSEQDLQFFEQLRNLLPTALLSNADFLTAGVPPAGAAGWLELLAINADDLDAIVDTSGLVRPDHGTPEQYLDEVRKKIASAVDSALGLVDSSLRQSIIVNMTGVILQVRDAQASLVKETLAVYAGVGVDQAVPILHWANATVYQLLQHVLERTQADAEASARDPRKASVLLDLSDLLAQVRRRSEVVSTLGLSATLLQEYLDYGHEAWLGQVDKHKLTMHTLYYLTVLVRAFAQGEQPEQKLLDYLRHVNALPKVTGDALTLAQQAAAIRLANFLGWSVQEVRECIDRIDTTDLKVLKTLRQLDLLMRVRSLSAGSGMAALTSFLIGDLPETIDRQAYAEAAELALLSESVTPMVHVPVDLNGLISITCVAKDERDLVANKPGEKRTYLVTLKDAEGNPLSGVNVYWRTTLGSIETGMTWTDGTLEANFIPGKVMGSETPLYWLDLFEPWYAPSVTVTFDADTLSFPSPELSPVPLGEVPPGREVELYAVLEDKYGNRPADSLVDWFFESVPPETSASAVIRPAHGFTGEQGLTRVFVSSRTGGTFYFSVLSHPGESREIFPDPITFASE
jgi:hypothetical protein